MSYFYCDCNQQIVDLIQKIQQPNCSAIVQCPKDDSRLLVQLLLMQFLLLAAIGVSYIKAGLVMLLRSIDGLSSFCFVVWASLAAAIYLHHADRFDFAGELARLRDLFQ